MIIIIRVTVRVTGGRVGVRVRVRVRVGVSLHQAHLLLCRDEARVHRLGDFFGP